MSRSYLPGSAPFSFPDCSGTAPSAPSSLTDTAARSSSNASETACSHVVKFRPWLRLHGISCGNG